MKKTTLFAGAALSLGVGVLASSAVFAAEETFTDPAFRSCINEVLSQSGSTASEEEQLGIITILSCEDYGISDLSGIEKLPALREINLSGNNLTSADFSSNANLHVINLNHNKLTSFTLPASTYSFTLIGNTAEKIALDTSKATQLESLSVVNSKIDGKLDLSKNTDLLVLNLRGTGLKTIDLTKNTKLNAVGVEANLGSARNVDYTGDDAPVLMLNIEETEIPGAIATDGTQTVSTDPLQAFDLSGVIKPLVVPNDGSVPVGFIDGTKIEESEDYIFDSTSNLLAIRNPDAIHGFVVLDRFKVYLPINDEALLAEDEELDVPSTSIGEPEKENPDTSTSSKLMLGLSVLGIAVLGVAIKAALSTKKA